MRIDATEKGRIRTLDDMAKLSAHAIIVALGVDADGDVRDVFHAHKLTDDGDVWDVCGGPKDVMTSQEILDQDLLLATLSADIMPATNPIRVDYLSRCPRIGLYRDAG